MTTADRIRELRLSRQVTQQELGDSIKMNQSVVNRIERGTRPIRDDELKTIARYFGVTTDYLLGNETSAEPVEKDDAVRMYRQLPAADKDMVARMIAALFAQYHNSVAASHVGA